MSFRQHNKDPNTAWRRDHRDALLKHGMPDSVVDDERRWTYVLLHGADEFESGWNPTWITKEQAQSLLTLLQSQYTNPVGLDLITALQRRTDAQ